MSNPTQPYAHLFEKAVWPSGPTLVQFEAKDEPPEELISNVNAVPVLPGGQLVIIQLADGKWEIPGGTVEPDESPLETLKRELQEEAGAMLHSATYIGAWKMTSQARKPFRPHLAHPTAYRAVYLCEVSLFSEPQIPIDGGEQVVRVEAVNLDGIAERFTKVERLDLAELYRFAVDMKGNQKQPVTNITTILFDLDGTLVQHGHVLLPAILADWGYTRSPGDIEFVVEEQLHWVYKETIKAGEWTPAIVREWQSRILGGLDIPDPDGELVQQLLDYYKTSPVPPIYPDAVTLLAQLGESNYQLGIITQRGRNGTEKFLNEHGIRHHFDSIVCGSDGHGRKPSAGPFLKSLENLDCTADEAIYIGDRIDDDCEGATGAGLRAYLIDRYDRFSTAAADRTDFTYLTSLTELNSYLPAK